jgi:phytol kinase
MLAVIACLFIIFALLVIAEILWQKKILRGEDQRKFVHISVGVFLAFLPWFVSRQATEWIGILMMLVVLLNRQRPTLNFIGHFRHKNDWGDVLLAGGVVVAALLTGEKIFFTIAILHLALADGLAGLIGAKFGKNWQYRVFNQTKTLVGSMAFWFISLSILGPGLLLAHNLIDFPHYAVLLLALPPVLTAIESLAIHGFDNVAVPVAVILALNLAKTG